LSPPASEDDEEGLSRLEAPSSSVDEPDDEEDEDEDDDS